MFYVYYCIQFTQLVKINQNKYYRKYDFNKAIVKIRLDHICEFWDNFLFFFAKLQNKLRLMWEIGIYYMKMCIFRGMLQFKTS